MSVTLRILFAVAGAIASIVVLAGAHSDHTLVAAGVGLLLVSVGLVIP